MIILNTKESVTAFSDLLRGLREHADLLRVRPYEHEGHSYLRVETEYSYASDRDAAVRRVRGCVGVAPVSEYDREAFVFECGFLFELL